jgi:hypothetical protein
MIEEKKVLDELIRIETLSVLSLPPPSIDPDAQALSEFQNETKLANVPHTEE